jgi:hypothetical protein
LAFTKSSWDFVRADFALFLDGQQQFGFASDLVGTQCPVPLGV